jgi:hypothetical protein
VFSQPKRRIFGFDFIPYLYQTDHAESNGAIGKCPIGWHLRLFRHFQEICEVFREKLYNGEELETGDKLVE